MNADRAPNAVDNVLSVSYHIMQRDILIGAAVIGGGALVFALVKSFIHPDPDPGPNPGPDPDPDFHTIIPQPPPDIGPKTCRQSYTGIWNAFEHDGYITDTFVNQLNSVLPNCGQYNQVGQPNRDLAVSLVGKYDWVCREVDHHKKKTCWEFHDQVANAMGIVISPS